MNRFSPAAFTLITMGSIAFFGCSHNGPTSYVQDTESANSTDSTSSTTESDQESDSNNLQCGEIEISATRQPVDMLVVLDRSDSMQGMLWRNMGEALSEITQTMSDKINFGLIMFPSLDCDEGDSLEFKCLPPQGNEVPYVAIGDSHAAETIAAVFELASQGGVGTCGNTPTASTLDVARIYLDSLSASNRIRAVLLATDGAPNCNMALDGAQCPCTWLDSKCTSGLVEYCLDDARTVAAAGNAWQSGYPVYVLGVGNSVEWEPTMNAIAAAGGTQEYHPVTDPDKLLSVLASITGSIVSCEFAIDWSSLPANASTDKSKVNFYCKDAPDSALTQDNLIGFDENCAAGTGWKWEGDNAVFCPIACDRLKSGACHSIQATFGCDSQVLVK